MLLQSRKAEVRALFERLHSLRSDVGLLSGQYDAEYGERLGNMPQALSHVAMIKTALRFHDVSGTPRGV